MILVTTPTGDIGARVLDQLLKADVPIRVIVRDQNKLPESAQATIDIIEGSHADNATITAALDGIDRVFWLPPGTPDSVDAQASYVDFSRPFATALRSSNVTHVVGISALGGGWAKPAGLVSASLAMDDLIGKSGVAYRALACASLMDNLMRQIDPIRNGAFYAPTPADLSLPLVAKSDVAACVVRLLLRPDWDGVADIPLQGPQDLSHDEMARILSDVLNRPVSFHEMSMKDFDSMLRATGASDGMARDYVAMMAAKNEGLDTLRSDAPRDNTPTTFRAWAEAELRPAVLK